MYIPNDLWQPYYAGTQDFAVLVNDTAKNGFINVSYSVFSFSFLSALKMNKIEKYQANKKKTLPTHNWMATQHKLNIFGLILLQAPLFITFNFLCLKSCKII